MNPFLSWLAARETREAAYGLALGFPINFALLVTQAQAGGVLTATAAAFQTFAVAGALGGLTAALIHFVAQTFAEERTPRHKVVRAAVEGVCAVIVGTIVAHYGTNYAGAWLPRVDPADLLWLAYAIGVFAWRVMPGLIATVQALMQPKTLLVMLRDALNKAFSGSTAGDQS